MADQLIAEFDRNPLEKIRVQIREYRGHRYIDVRTYYLDDNDNQWKPTRKGLTLNLETSALLREALEKAEEIFEEEG
ncbi:MAG TPA: transcriptional coactivator p15 [Armatimonadetes bacterium]|nr:transcriptional coactivator p15 [Armatimonadota bacterium]